MVSKTEAKAACAKCCYAYVANDLLNATDPTGEVASVIPVAMCAANPACRGAIGAAVGGLIAGGASVASQAFDGQEGIDWGRVGVDAGKGAVVGGVSGATLNPNAATATAGLLGAIDGGVTAATDGDPHTTVVGGALRQGATDAIAAHVGARIGGGASPVQFPSQEGVGMIAGAASGPVVDQLVGEPIGNTVDAAVDAGNQFVDQAGSTINDGLQRMEQGCLPPRCQP